MPKIEVYQRDGGGRMLLFACPGCKHNHSIYLDVPGSNGAKWTWNGDLEKPTITPSILSRLGPWPDNHKTKAGMTDVCHSFVRGGRIEFLHDCTHELKGQTLDLPEVQKDWSND